MMFKKHDLVAQGTCTFNWNYVSNALERGQTEAKIILDENATMSTLNPTGPWRVKIQSNGDPKSCLFVYQTPEEHSHTPIAQKSLAIVTVGKGSQASFVTLLPLPYPVVQSIKAGTCISSISLQRLGCSQMPDPFCCNDSVMTYLLVEPITIPRHAKAEIKLRLETPANCTTVSNSCWNNHHGIVLTSCISNLKVEYEDQNFQVCSEEIIVKCRNNSVNNMVLPRNRQAFQALCLHTNKLHDKFVKKELSDSDVRLARGVPETMTKSEKEPVPVNPENPEFHVKFHHRQVNDSCRNLQDCPMLWVGEIILDEPLPFEATVQLSLNSSIISNLTPRQRVYDGKYVIFQGKLASPRQNCIHQRDSIIGKCSVLQQEHPKRLTFTGCFNVQDFRSSTKDNLDLTEGESGVAIKCYAANSESSKKCIAQRHTLRIQNSHPMLAIPNSSNTLANWPLVDITVKPLGDAVIKFSDIVAKGKCNFNWTFVSPVLEQKNVMIALAEDANVSRTRVTGPWKVRVTNVTKNGPIQRSIEIHQDSEEKGNARIAQRILITDTNKNCYVTLLPGDIDGCINAGTVLSKASIVTPDCVKSKDRYCSNSSAMKFKLADQVTIAKNSDLVDLKLQLSNSEEFGLCLANCHGVILESTIANLHVSSHFQACNQSIAVKCTSISTTGIQLNKDQLVFKAFCLHTTVFRGKFLNKELLPIACSKSLEAKKPTMYGPGMNVIWFSQPSQSPADQSRQDEEMQDPNPGRVSSRPGNLKTSGSNTVIMQTSLSLVEKAKTDQKFPTGPWLVKVTPVPEQPLVRIEGGCRSRIAQDTVSLNDNGYGLVTLTPLKTVDKLAKGFILCPVATPKAEVVTFNNKTGKRSSNMFCPNDSPITFMSLTTTTFKNFQEKWIDVVVEKKDQTAEFLECKRLCHPVKVQSVDNNLSSLGFKMSTYDYAHICDSSLRIYLKNTSRRDQKIAVNCPVIKVVCLFCEKNYFSEMQKLLKRHNLK